VVIIIWLGFNKKNLIIKPINNSEFRHEIITKTPIENESFVQNVQRYALNGVIAVATFDVTYASMALNLYLTSFKKMNIDNYLFIATDNLGCEKLKPFGAHCIHYMNSKKAKRASVYGSRDYNINTCLKPKIVLDSLKCGLDILLVDLDIVFFQNPLPFFTKYRDFDFISQLDPSGNSVNSGFFLVRNTIGGIRLFEEINKIIPKKPTRNDQDYVNNAVRRLGKITRIQYLPTDIFPLGNKFFNAGHRMFVGDNPCKKCVIMHNNYISSVEAKIYRFKEYGLWLVDEHLYYSDTNRKYIKYDNPVDFNVNKHGIDTTIEMELVSLKAALIIGQILNRTVILPKFHCRGAKGYKPLPGQMCHFAMHFAVRRFNYYLPALGAYRESVFLEHPLVPESTKKSISKLILIDGPVWHKPYNATSRRPDHVRIYDPKEHHISSSEIKKWFLAESAKVLSFHSLYNEFDKEEDEIRDILIKLNKAIVRSNFLQIRQ